MDMFTGRLQSMPTEEQNPWWRRALTWTTGTLAEGYIVDKHAKFLAANGTTVAVGVALWLAGVPTPYAFAAAGFANQGVIWGMEWVPGAEGAVKRHLFKASDALMGGVNLVRSRFNI